MQSSDLLENPSLGFLFQEISRSSRQKPLYAPFSAEDAMIGGLGFKPQTSPSQTPKKRQVFLDYNSCYRLWNSVEMALEIAKLKDEGFDVAFILKKTDGEIFASSIEYKADGDKKSEPYFFLTKTSF